LAVVHAGGGTQHEAQARAVVAQQQSVGRGQGDVRVPLVELQRHECGGPLRQIRRYGQLLTSTSTFRVVGGRGSAFTVVILPLTRAMRSARVAPGSMPRDLETASLAPIQRSADDLGGSQLQDEGVGLLVEPRCTQVRDGGPHVAGPRNETGGERRRHAGQGGWRGAPGNPPRAARSPVAGPGRVAEPGATDVAATGIRSSGLDVDEPVMTHGRQRCPTRTAPGPLTARDNRTPGPRVRDERPLAGAGDGQSDDGNQTARTARHSGYAMPSRRLVVPSRVPPRRAWHRPER
jgi:hypothetical protein